MGEIIQRSGSAKVWLAVIALLAVAAVVIGLLVWQPGTSPRADPSSSGKGTSANGVIAGAEFPSSPQSRVDVQIIETTEQMLDAAPESFSNLATASFNMVDATLPAEGATITFDLPSPAPDDRGVMIAHWNEQDGMWEPVETVLSGDRRRASATVSHFSPYGAWDYAYASNYVNQVFGNAAASGVECDSPMPEWVNPHYFDDMNGPIRWCGGKDPKNADILVAKLKMNRASAALISTAVKPAWVWSDLWGDMGPETMLQMASTAAMGTPSKLADGYIVQPFGEYNFGFSRSDIESFYADGRWENPLVQVSMGWQYTLFGALYDAMKDQAQGNIAGAVAMLALGQCSHELAPSPNSEGTAQSISDVMGCIGSSMDALEKGALTFITKKVTVSDQMRGRTKTAISRLRFVAQKFAYVSASLKLVTTVGDMALPDIARQFLYRPSLSAIKAAAEKKKAANTATKFVTLDPWRDGTLALATDTHDSAGRDEGCTSSEISPRKDGFRCFAPGIYDPCYQNPTTSSDFLCFFWTNEERRITHLKNVPAKAPSNATAPADSSIVMAELIDGTICRRATGAGPQGVPGYPYWTGVCMGPSGGVWRIGEADTWKGSLSTRPLYPPAKVGGYHRVAISVGTETSPAQLVDVKTAYR